MSRPITNPTHDDLELLLTEPVEVHVRTPESDPIYRGILIDLGGRWGIRSFGSDSPLYYDEDNHTWTLIRRLEITEITPAEQREWYAHEPLIAISFAWLDIAGSTL